MLFFFLALLHIVFALRRALGLDRLLLHSLSSTTAESPLAGKLPISCLTSFKRLGTPQANAAGAHTATGIHQTNETGITVVPQTSLCIGGVTRWDTTSRLVRNSQLDTTAVKSIGKSTVSHLAGNVTQGYLTVATTESVTQRHLMAATSDTTGAPATLTPSVNQLDTPEERTSLPTPIVSDPATIGVEMWTTTNAIVAQADLVLPPAITRSRLPTMPSS